MPRPRYLRGLLSRFLNPERTVLTVQPWELRRVEISADELHAMLPGWTMRREGGGWLFMRAEQARSA